MSLSTPHHLALGSVLALVFLGPGCNGRNVVGMQSGNGGSAGGVGGGSGGGSPDGQVAVPDGEAGTTGVGGFTGEGGMTGAAGFTGEAGTTGAGGFAGDWGIAGVIGSAGVTGAAGFGGDAGTSGIVCGASSPGLGGSSGGFRFLPAVQHAVPRTSFAVAVGDLNADGKPDLVLTNGDHQDRGGASGDDGAGGGGGSSFQTHGSVSVLLSDGGSGYRPPQHYLVAGAPAAAAIGDLNTDGRPDLVVARSQSVSVLFNDGGGGLLAPVTFATGQNPSVAVGDVNGDGRLDFAVGNYYYPGSAGEALDGDVTTFLNWGAGTFIASNYPAGPRPTSLVVADLTGVGRRDLAVASGPGVSVLTNDPPGFAAARAYGVGTHPVRVVAGDLNGDGWADLAVTGGRGTSVMLNLGGVFAAAIDYGPSLVSLVIGDLNGDGRPELAGSTGEPCDIVAILPNAGNGTFGSPVYIPTTSNSGRYGAVIALADMNGDRVLDLLVPNAGGVAVLVNAAP